MEALLQYIFEDREHAGRLLADKLLKYKDKSDVILAVTRGGIPLAFEVVKRIGFSVEILLIKKIGDPQNRGCVIGAATLTDYSITQEVKIPKNYLKNELKSIRTKLRHMYQIFLGSRHPRMLKGKIVIFIDDDVANGTALHDPVQIIKKSKPAKIIAAIPVASKEAVRKLLKEVDEVITVMVSDEFTPLSVFFRNFEQVTEKEVLVYLNKLRVWRLS